MLGVPCFNWLRATCKLISGQYYQGLTSVQVSDKMLLNMAKVLSGEVGKGLETKTLVQPQTPRWEG